MLTMKNYDLETYLKANTVFVVPITLALLIIIFGSIGMYLAEHKHVGANITRLGDALWFTVATITTVGYGDYYPITLAGRLIAILVMFSGIGIVVTLVGLFSQRRLQHVESRLMPKSKARSIASGDETKTVIKDKIEEVEKLTDEDFDTLVITLKSLRRTLLEESKISYKCSRCGHVYYSKLKFCSNCGLDLT